MGCEWGKGHFIKPSVEAAMHQKLIMTAFLDNPSPVKDNDKVSIANGGQPVSDNHCSPSFQKMLEALLKKVLGLRVNVGGGFVQKKDSRISQKRPGKADKLALSHTEILSPLLKLGVVPLFQSQDEIVRTHCLGSGHYVIVGSIKVAVANVVFNRAREKERVLKD